VDSRHSQLTCLQTRVTWRCWRRFGGGQQAVAVDYVRIQGSRGVLTALLKAAATARMMQKSRKTMTWDEVYSTMFVMQIRV
jgi:hypothetical protein